MATLCAKAAGGQDFARLYVDNLAFVRRVLQRFGVPVRDAADVAQDLFATVLQKVTAYNPARPIRCWLFVFAVRFAKDYRVAGARREALCPFPPHIANEMTSAEEMLLAHEERQTAKAAVERLDPKLREILRRHDVDGSPMPEIARDLGIPLDTGYTRLRRARAQLCGELKRGTNGSRAAERDSDASTKNGNEIHKGNRPPDTHASHREGAHLGTGGGRKR